MDKAKFSEFVGSLATAGLVFRLAISNDKSKHAEVRKHINAGALNAIARAGMVINCANGQPAQVSDDELLFALCRINQQKKPRSNVLQLTIRPDADIPADEWSFTRLNVRYPPSKVGDPRHMSHDQPGPSLFFLGT
jgi:hypothetical protein